MHCLITGGAGFIGSHLADALLEEMNVVTVLDDLSTGAIENIQHLRGNPDFHQVTDTMMNRQLLAELVDQADVIFHLAAAVGVRLIIESPVRTIETNVRPTELLLELATKKRKTVLIASTSEVYGKSRKFPFSEDDDLVIGSPDKGRWSYACSKALDEFLALAYWREKKLPAIIVRLFNTIGPRQTGQYGMVVPTFIRQAMAGETLTVFGNGHQSRCFGWVGDVVQAMITLVKNPNAPGKVFNVGNDEEVSILELAERVKRVTLSESRIRLIPYHEAYESGFEDMPRRIPNLSRIRQLIGYRPTKTLDEILLAIATPLQERIPAGVRLMSAPTSASLKFPPAQPIREI
jgi:UDP-glucose 4-epimerase